MIVREQYEKKIEWRLLGLLDVVDFCTTKVSECKRQINCPKILRMLWRCRDL